MWQCECMYTTFVMSKYKQTRLLQEKFKVKQTKIVSSKQDQEKDKVLVYLLKESHIGW